jgi:hypothetical protein
VTGVVFIGYNLLNVNKLIDKTFVYAIGYLVDIIIFGYEKPIKTNVKFKEYSQAQVVLLPPSWEYVTTAKAIEPSMSITA